jgi:cbb3-type cytochrome oxidase cytochrome c subunit
VAKEQKPFDPVLLDLTDREDHAILTNALDEWARQKLLRPRTKVGESAMTSRRRAAGAQHFRKQADACACAAQRVGTTARREQRRPTTENGSGDPCLCASCTR